MYLTIILTWNKLFELTAFFKCVRQSWKFREDEVWGPNKTVSLCWYPLTHPGMSSFNDKMLLFQFYMHFFSNGFLKLNLIFCCEEDIRRVKGKKRKIIFSHAFFFNMNKHVPSLIAWPEQSCGEMLNSPPFPPHSHPTLYFPFCLGGRDAKRAICPLHVVLRVEGMSWLAHGMTNYGFIEQ